MEVLVRILERVTSAIGYVAAVTILPLIFATCYEVFARYLFGAPTIWAFELGYSLTGAHFLLGVALTLKLGGHIRIDLLYARFPPRRQAVVDLVLYVVLLLPFLLLLSRSLFSYAFNAYMNGERSGASAWNPPIWPFRAVIALGIVLLLLQVLAEIAKCILTLAGRLPSPSADVER